MFGYTTLKTSKMHQENQTLLKAVLRSENPGGTDERATADVADELCGVGSRSTISYSAFL